MGRISRGWALIRQGWDVLKGLAGAPWPGK